MDISVPGVAGGGDRTVATPEQDPGAHTGRGLVPRVNAAVAVMTAAALVLTVAWSWEPSMWADELATVGSVSSLDVLWDTLRQRDAVFLPYYVLMYLWTRLGTADWWVRLPSALAVAAATGLLTDLGRRLAGARAGVAAGVALLVLPSMARFGQEARPYTLAVAAAVFSFWALHRATETGRWGRYVLAVALLPCAHLFAVLVLPAHLVITRRCLPWLALGSPPALALAALSAGQVGQVGWLGPPTWQNIVLVRSAITAWMPEPEPGDLPAVVLGWLVALAGLAAAVYLWRREPGRRAFVAGAVVWGVLPTAVLCAVSFLGTPVYNSRYVLAAAPAFALLAGMALGRARLPVRLAALAAAAALALPQQAHARTASGHQVNYRDAAAVAAAGARPGDRVAYAVPWAREGLTRYAAMPPEMNPREAMGVRVWLVRERTDRPVRPGTSAPSRYGLARGAIPKVDVLLENRFAVRRVWHFRGVTVLLLERGTPPR
ncbi:glycosyltransferase family 39 protein [Sphaerisporangium sp. NPDC051017]|uniref:glycosyltransferase family 39 protein n=1 Tax=Sphaerisporangium sp. NPDC051017 TaxID=3154636 RepID=UPI00343F04F0